MTDDHPWTTLHLLHPVLLRPHVAAAMPWESALHALPGTWSAAQPTRITVPAGAAGIELKAGICFQSEPSGSRRIFTRRNGSSDESEANLFGQHSGGWATKNSVSFTARSAIMPAVPGDYFELFVFHDAARDLWVGGAPETDHGAIEAVAYGCVYFEARFYGRRDIVAEN